VIRSIRGRLTLWYGSVVTIILIAVCGSVYALMAKTLWQGLNSRLDSGLSQVAASLPHELSERPSKAEGEAYFRHVVNTDHQASMPGELILVYEGDRLVALKPPARYSGSAQQILRDPQRRRLSGVQRWSENQWRAIARDVYYDASGSTYRVIVAESERPARTALGILWEGFLLVVPLGVLLAAGSGYLLARKSLAPVVEMSEAVAAISSHNLERRIPVSNPGDELGRLAGVFNALLGRLEQAFHQQRRFMADASHELRTPLSISHTAAQVTLEKPTREEGDYREALAIIDKNTVRLSRLVEDMFLLAQADAGGVPLRVSRFYLEELLMDAAHAATVLGDRKGVRVRMEPADETPYSGDEALIRQLVMILLDNAVKYTPSGGTVELKLEAGRQSLEILVSDTGEAIPMEARPRLFERFFRVDRSRSVLRENGGAGLGLSIAQWIAHIHRGEVTLRSSSAGGNVFAVVLPLGGLAAHSSKLA
jgi:heavy metal sensor kinase